MIFIQKREFSKKKLFITKKNFPEPGNFSFPYLNYGKIVSLEMLANISTRKAIVYLSPKTALLVNDGMKTIHITLVEMHHLHQNYVQIISAQIMTESLLGATPPIRINDMMSVMSREYNKTSNVNGQ